MHFNIFVNMCYSTINYTNKFQACAHMFMFKPPYKNLRIWGFPNTEADCPSKHPDLGQKVNILDKSVWLEETNLPAPWSGDCFHIFFKAGHSGVTNFTENQIE